ncbi:hypothetical protein KA089_00230 [Candidatus Woesebacteria bacterium]|nr:hypothetical protein [Candidatus Woesebacteria bacterium]
MKKIIIATFIILSLFTVTIRGNFGIPTSHQIDLELNGNGQAFETSQERSRYAIILAMVNNHRFDLGEYASMGTPDIGQIDGKYYSFFPPTASILAIPLYLLGLKMNAPQILTFLISTIFSIASIIMIYIFMKSLRVHWSKAIFVVIAFAFATNAWGYSVTLYAHLLSAFTLIAGIYFATQKKPNWQNSLIVFTLYAFGIFLDFPNIFAFFPIALLVGLRLFEIKQIENKIKFNIKISMIVGPLIFLFLMGLYGFYNYQLFGHPLKFSNTLDRVRDLKIVENKTPEKKELDSVSALFTRDLINGLYTFTVSNDRGVLIYSPIILLFIFGLIELGKRDRDLKILLIAVPVINLLTYSMFGDPWGGWAYGSRYMIAIFPELLVIAGLGLDYFARQSKKFPKYTVLTIYSLVFIYSSSMALLSPLTTNVIPPSVEAGTYALADDARINRQMLRLNQLNSFVYNNYLHEKMSGYQYYYAILIPLNVYGLSLIWWPVNEKNVIKKKSKN